MNKTFDNKRILVTGATGLIGSNLVNYLSQFDNVDIIACGRSYSKLKQVFGSCCTNKIKVFEHDILDPLPLDLGNVDFIFHAASPISGAIISTNPVSVIESNIFGARNCLEYLRIQKEMHNVSGMFIVFSSATVYGNALSNVDRICAENDTTTCNPISSYASYSESKRMIEVLAMSYYDQHKIENRIIRFSYVYGKCKILPGTAFYEFARLATHGKDMVFGKNEFSRRDNIYVDDAINGLMLACQNGHSNIPYNVSSNGELGNFASINEIAEILSKTAAKHAINSLVIVKGHAKTLPGILLDNGRIKSLGWKLTVPLDVGISEVFQYVKDLDNEQLFFERSKPINCNRFRIMFA